MRGVLTSLVSGLIFAIGLGVSGMTKADKVIGFLDVAGDWDPSLAFVMVGAIGTHALLRYFIMGRSAPVFADRFSLPGRHNIDVSLVAGAAIFGAGWAMGGYCPGPGLVSLAGGSFHAVVFVTTLSVAIFGWQRLQHWIELHRQGKTPPDTSDVRVPGLSDPHSA